MTSSSYILLLCLSLVLVSASVFSYGDVYHVEQLDPSHSLIISSYPSSIRVTTVNLVNSQPIWNKSFSGKITNFFDFRNVSSNLFALILTDPHEVYTVVAFDSVSGAVKLHHPFQSKGQLVSFPNQKVLTYITSSSINFMNIHGSIKTCKGDFSDSLEINTKEGTYLGVFSKNLDQKFVSVFKKSDCNQVVEVLLTESVDVESITASVSSIFDSQVKITTLKQPVVNQTVDGQQDSDLFSIQSINYASVLFKNSFSNILNIGSNILFVSGSKLITQSLEVNGTMSFIDLPVESIGSKAEIFGQNIECVAIFKNSKLYYFDLVSKLSTAHNVPDQSKLIYSGVDDSNCPLLTVVDSDSVIGQFDRKGLTNRALSAEKVVFTTINESAIIHNQGQKWSSSFPLITSSVHKFSSKITQSDRLFYPKDLILLIFKNSEDEILVEILEPISKKIVYKKKHSKIILDSVTSLAANGRFIYSYLTTQSNERKVVVVQLLSKGKVTWKDVVKVKNVDNYELKDFEAVFQTYSIKSNLINLFTNQSANQIFGLLSDGRIASFNFDLFSATRLIGIPEKKAKKMSQILVYNKEIDIDINTVSDPIDVNLFTELELKPSILNINGKNFAVFSGNVVTFVEVFPYGRAVEPFTGLIDEKQAWTGVFGLGTIAIILYLKAILLK
ncbi:hypothetical protein RCL1_004127 [Eukaryota sp. TZLM3-RCL]